MPNPPKFFLRFFRWFCHPDLQQSVEGDLMELYYERLEESGKKKANLHFKRDVLLLFRKDIIKPSGGTYRLNYYGMFKSTITSFFRQLKKNPSQNATNIGGLAIGLCVVFLTLIWINHHLSFDQQHKDVDRIFGLMTNSKGSDGELLTTEGGVYEVVDQAKLQVSEIEQFTRVISNWRWPSEQCLKKDENKQCIYSKGMFADEHFFEIFDFEVIRGAQNPLLEPKSIALSESVSRKLYGDEDPIGKTYLLDNHFSVIITAVYKDVPATSSIQFDFIAPLEVAYGLWGRREEDMKEYSFITYLKLSSPNAATVQQQINELSTAQQYDNRAFILHPLKQKHLYTRFEQGMTQGGLIDYLYIIGVFSLFILLMSIVNFINLTTAQSSIRGKEIGVRKVNGASKSSLHFQLLLETLLKALLATFLAIVLAYLLLPMLSGIINEELRFEWTSKSLLVILIVISITTLLSGYYPAYMMSRFNPIQMLKSLPRNGVKKGNVRYWLTTVQIGISGIIVILTVGFYLQLTYMQTKSIGYEKEGILMLEPTYRHIKGFDSFSANLRNHSQIKGIGISNVNMINADRYISDVNWNGKSDKEETIFTLIGGDSGFLEVFGIEFLAGSGFNEKDTTDQLILTESAVKTMGLKNPIGQVIELYGEKGKIAGIIRDFNSASLHKNMKPTIIHELAPQNASTFYIRFDRTQALAAIELIEKEYDQLEPFFNMKSRILNEEYQKAYEEEQIVTTLSSISMIVALIISAIGILGLSTFNVLRRYREIGIRKIFGATRFQIVQILSRDFVIAVFVANLVAWPCSLWILDEWLSGFAYRIDIPYELLPFNLTLTFFLIIGLVVFKALRISRLNPSEVVRND